MHIEINTYNYIKNYEKKLIHNYILEIYNN